MRDSSSFLLSHEWLAPTGGSENVFEEMMKVFPESRTVCLWNDAPRRFGPQVEQSWIASTPLRKSKIAALPFMESAWKSIDLQGVEMVLASSHAFGHKLAERAANQGIPAFSYVHTPARYIWSPELDERGRSLLGRIGRSFFRWRDRSSVTVRVKYAANSQFVRRRISKVWGIDSEVVYPPVNVEGILQQREWCANLRPGESRLLESLPNTFVLGASRLIEYKRLDVAMRVGELLDCPVVIAGSGPIETQLREQSEHIRVPVHFVGRVSDEMLYALYQAAQLFVFMAVEDFGIMPVESVAAGTPVLVNRTGGAKESIEILQAGASANPDSTDDLRAAADKAASLFIGEPQTHGIHRFSSRSFRDNVRSWTSRS